MRKRGLSGIINVVLLILIVIVAIGIVWVSVHPKIIRSLKSSFGNDGKKGQVSCVSLDININKCVKDGDNYNVFVDRGSGNDKLGELRFSFDVLNDSEKTKVYSSVTDNLLGEFQKGKFYFSSSGLGVDEILSVRVAGIFENGDACGFSRSVNCYEENLGGSCGDGKINNEEQCDGDNLNGKICSDIPGFSGGTLSCGGDCNFNTDECTEDINLDCGNVIYLSDFDKNTCTRTRNGLVPKGVVPLPSAGIRVLGTGNDLIAAKNSGASIGRDVINWYAMYNSSGDLDFTKLDLIIDAYKVQGFKLIITLRSNDPERSELSFDRNGKSSLKYDSYPKDEQVWVNYLQRIVKRYWTGEEAEGKHAGVVAGIQIGNEWINQFRINESYGHYTDKDKDKAILDLMNLSYTAIKEVNSSIPVISFTVAGGVNPQFALADGYNKKGWIYWGAYYSIGGNGKDSVKILYQKDINLNDIPLKEMDDIIVNGSKFYDYFDAHVYFQMEDDPRYVANWIRDTWKKAGVVPKGLVSTEFGTPTYNYSYDLQSYMIKASQSVAFYSGFDAIVWGPSEVSYNLLQTSLKDDWGEDTGIYLQEQIESYNDTSHNTSDFISVSKINSTYSFNLTDRIGNITLGFDKTYPSYYQCSDGLDNDNDGLIDSDDPDCYDFYNLNDASRCNGIAKQNLKNNCIDPAGFSESNWIFD